MSNLTMPSNYVAMDDTELSYIGGYEAILLDSGLKRGYKPIFLNPDVRLYDKFRFNNPTYFKAPRMGAISEASELSMGAVSEAPQLGMSFATKALIGVGVVAAIAGIAYLFLK